MRRLIITVVIAALASCSKPPTWDYLTIEGDDETLSNYGGLGWELVSRTQESDGWYKMTLKRPGDYSETSKQASDEIEIDSKEAKRRIEHLKEWADSTPVPKPKWEQEYEQKMAALNAREAELPALIDGNERLIDASEKLADAQIDGRADLDDAGKIKAKAAASAYFEKLRQANDGTPLKSGTFLSGDKF